MIGEDVAVGWQTSPNRRGTLMIIQDCLFTIVACTWSIQHPNVPKLDEGWLPALLQKCKWTVFTLFFPEFLMAHAILEFVMAVEDMKLLDERRLLDEKSPWFFRYIQKPPAGSRDVETGAEQGQNAHWSLTHCYVANMGGFYINANDRHHPLTSRNFAQHWERINIPCLSEDDLKDKSKTDYFTKALAVIQITQLLLSIISRAVEHLAISQLETLTLAFAICGVLTYICSWYKPQDVKRPIQVSLRDGEEWDPAITRRSFDSLWRVLSNLKIIDDNEPLQRIPNDNIPKTKGHETHYALYVLTALTAGFGSIHAIAWNFEFPTFPEQILWRVSTLLSTIVPPVALLAIPLAQILVPWGDSDDFKYACLDIMREFSWQAPDNRQVQDAIQSLQGACASLENKHFEEIFGNGTDSKDFLGKRLLQYIEKSIEIQEGLPKGFVPRFAQLVEILEGSLGSKRLWEAARTNTYPQRSIFGPLVNNGIIYATSILYCLARLSIIGVAFSSLRLMPESVYKTPWTNNFPSIQ
ncbi:hypothetical protein O1611_g7899 [Lasiodiplodia mahajangana]|uniref:Uncharacterized protein n=1 Tax=Lasiodiplodia mahajangana TaxID=1108764 RepID=A0ACC2JEE4_9PEZI|nr:hypothetical protein O1611_g7899 [Lasiodiplodia mahajangana]